MILKSCCHHLAMQKRSSAGIADFHTHLAARKYQGTNSVLIHLQQQSKTGKREHLKRAKKRYYLYNNTLSSLINTEKVQQPQYHVKL